MQGWELVGFSELFKLACNIKECRHPDAVQIGFCVCVWDEKNLLKVCPLWEKVRDK